MIAPLVFVVPGAPVPCARARVVRGHAFTPERTRAYEQHVRAVATIAVLRARWSPPAGSAFAITLDVYRAARRGDWDNFSKGVCDGMNGVVWPDDRHVQVALVRMHVDRANPRVEVDVRVLDEAAA